MFFYFPQYILFQLKPIISTWTTLTIFQLIFLLHSWPPVIHSYPVAIKIYFQNLKYVTTLSSQNFFNDFETLLKTVHFEMLACFNYFINTIKSTNSYELSTMKRSFEILLSKSNIKKLLLYLRLNSLVKIATIFWVIIVNFKIQSFDSLIHPMRELELFNVFQYHVFIPAKSYFK